MPLGRPERVLLRRPVPRPVPAVPVSPRVVVVVGGRRGPVSLGQQVGHAAARPSHGRQRGRVEPAGRTHVGDPLEVPDGAP